MLKHVSTPWSESVEELVQECLKVDHSSAVAMLEKQYSLLKLKKLLHGYGIRDFNFTDTSKGWVSVCTCICSTMSLLKHRYMYTTTSNGLGNLGSQIDTLRIMSNYITVLNLILRMLKK